MKDNIFLIGFMGTGKSTVSKELCRMLKFLEIDMDGEIENREKMKISEMFEKYGETYFRCGETKLVQEFEKKSGYVISCGGGVVLKEENVASMKRSGVVVLLTAKPQTIYERVSHSKNRPLLNNNMSVEHIEEMMRKREAAYEGAADITVVTDGKRPREIAEEIFLLLFP